LGCVTDQLRDLACTYLGSVIRVLSLPSWITRSGQSRKQNCKA